MVRARASSRFRRLAVVSFVCVGVWASASIVHGLEMVNPDVLYTVDGPTAYDELGSKIETLDDVSGDGVPDFAVAAQESWKRPGRVEIVSGADGTILRTLRPRKEDPSTSLFGETIENVGDQNEDGFDDVMVYASLFAQIRSCVDGAVIRTYLIDDTWWLSRSRNEFFRAGDMDADGWEDFFVGDDEERDPARGISLSRHGSLNLLSGRTGDLIWQRVSPRSDDYFGRVLAPLGDVNEDGISDFATSGARWVFDAPDRSRDLERVYVISGPRRVRSLRDRPYEAARRFRREPGQRRGCRRGRCSRSCRRDPEGACVRISGSGSSFDAQRANR